ncbi:formyltransferase family protein [Chryseobacterium arthrosphaerae]|uniref:methionyl-tRNA formyltransferase n=1 Tax=Chryseobacterium arthrosphaerae TaxID=651561 RepID=UPI0023E2D4DA|nr:formyltransferase family protein [Chryseobacterium arthrosphaerae]WET00132.1 formyltransferase family protein [Chryseobacterium arthrosphaerae]
MYRILVIGAVNSTAKIIQKLIENGLEVVGVLGHEPKDKEKISGWADLAFLSSDLKIDYRGFTKINDAENLKWASEKKVDVIFAVGFSQLLHEQWFSVAKLGCIGFHPTKLPIGRGRAPLAWVTLEQTYGSATFFLMGKGADDGPVFVQSIFKIEEDDDAESVEHKILENIDLALDQWLPELKEGLWNPIPQCEHLASYYGVRKEEDGLINWNDGAGFINRLIKAASKPHPGAYTYCKDEKLIIWSCRPEKDIQFKGVIGRVLMKNDKKELLVQTGGGLLWIEEYEFKEKLDISINVGDKLGYNIEDEIYKIKTILKKINE